MTYLVRIQKPCTTRQNPANHTMLLVVNLDSPTANDWFAAEAVANTWLHDNNYGDCKVDSIRAVTDVARVS